MFRRIFTNYISGIIFGVIIFIMSVLPMNADGVGGLFTFPGADKVIHATIYGAFTVLLIRGYLRSNPMSWKKITYLLLAILIYSIIIEMIQLFLTSYRTGEVLDVLANMVGILLGAAVVIIYRKVKY